MRAPGSASQLQLASPHYGWEASPVAQLVCASSLTTPAMEQQRKNTSQAQWQKYNYKSMYIVYIMCWCGHLVVFHHTRKIILPARFVSTSLLLFYLVLLLLTSSAIPENAHAWKRVCPQKKVRTFKCQFLDRNEEQCGWFWLEGSINKIEYSRIN